MSNTTISSGTVGNETLQNGATLTVIDSGGASGVFVKSGGVLLLSAGGVASLTSVDPNGYLTVASGGSAFQSYIEEAYLSVGAGGSAFDVHADISSEILIGGVVSGVQLSQSTDVIESGGTQYAAFANSGATIFVQGKNIGATVGSGAYVSVAAGGLDSGSFLQNDSTFEIGSGGVARSTSLGYGGLELVLSGGTAAGTVQSGGNLIVDGGADATGMAVQGGGRAVSSGIAIYTALVNSLSMSPQTENITLSNADETQFVLAGGIASQTQLNEGAIELVLSGGTAAGSVLLLSPDVRTEARIIAYDGGTVSAATINNGLGLVSGGTFYNTTLTNDNIESGGALLEMMSGATSGTDLGIGGTEVVFGGVAYNTTVEQNGMLDVYGIRGRIGSSDDTTIYGGSAESVYSGGVAFDTTIDHGALDLSNGGTALGTIGFTGSGGDLYINSHDLTTATITGFDTSDTITFRDLSFNEADYVTVSVPGTVTVVADGTSYALGIADAAINTHFELQAGYQGNGLSLIEAAPCFAAGTGILTPRGEALVEALAPGDLVITNEGADAPIVWIGRRRIDISRHPRPDEVRPVRIAADSFGAGVPARDLLISPDHAVFFEGCLIPAKVLVNGRNVRQVECRGVTYFHVELAEHGVIFAENCPVETYLETGNRGAFENGEAVVALHPDFAQTLREQQSCAPFVTEGRVLDAARARTMAQFYVNRRRANI